MGGVVSFCFSMVVFSSGSVLLRSGFIKWDVGRRGARVFAFLFKPCQVRVLWFISSGSLGDVSESFFLFMRYVNENSSVVSSCVSGWVGFRGRRAYQHVSVV